MVFRGVVEVIEVWRKGILVERWKRREGVDKEERGVGGSGVIEREKRKGS